MSKSLSKFFLNLSPKTMSKFPKSASIDLELPSGQLTKYGEKKEEATMKSLSRYRPPNNFGYGMCANKC